MTQPPEKQQIKGVLVSKSADTKSEDKTDLDGREQFLGSKTETAIVTKSVQFSGPIPHPDTLKKYNDIVPGLADRIVSMAELDQKHIHEMERKALDQPHQYAIIGIFLGALVALAGIGASVCVTVKGYPWVGTGLFGTTLAVIVIAFIKSRRGGDIKNEDSTPPPKSKRRR